jgi:fluoride ion exporter CrcB/FEX
VVLDTDAGEPGKALVYVLVSVVGGIAAAAAGYALGRRLA